jgi:myo-inositol-1-phosphate synthase
VVVINVASTEPTPAAPLPDNLIALRKAINAGQTLPVSTLYAYAALDLGDAYVNFTPSPGASSAALDELATERATVHAGSDGKTGETLMKTALAPMFALRNLRVASWFGQNILGNDDGRTLQDPAARGTKVGSKRDALPAILGYPLESHVGIDYVEALGDWKVAWNHILFDGFLGTRMSMQVIWQGADSILAAPLMIDLVRFVDLARRRGERGLLPYLGFFFKRPLGSTEHRLDRQFSALCVHLGVA